MANISNFAKNGVATKENYEIWKLLKEETEEIAIYFDTADIIDMLIGMQALCPLPAYSFKWDTYKEAKQLVYAVAYKGWLGSIYLLPPHLAELYDKLKAGRFNTIQPNDLADIGETFWGSPEILSRGVAQLIRKEGQPDAQEKRRWLDQFVHRAPHIFQGAYLLDNETDWRKRYAYLKTNAILCFDEEVNDAHEIAQSELFKALYKALNASRKSTTANNYIDALALCMFDQKLAEAEQAQTTPCFFYAEQKHIYDAVVKVSASKIAGRNPFYYHHQDTDLKFLALRPADFFFLYGILKVVRTDFTELWEPLETYLESVANEKNLDVKRLSIGNVDPRLRLFLMEFFQTWWREDGIQDLKKPFPLQSVDPSLVDDVDAYMKREFHSLKPKIKYGPEVMKIIKQTFIALKNMAKRVQELYADPFSMDAMHEFGPRFSFGPSVCDEIQHRFDELKEVAFVDSENDVATIESSIVTNISNVLTSDDQQSSEQIKEMLNSLASALGILWLLNKYELINHICSTIRELPHLMSVNTDKYPSSPFAIMHVAALLSTPNPNLDEVLQIIRCVEDKYGLAAKDKSYKIWLALSYAYYRLAACVFSKVFFPPEDLSPRERESRVRSRAMGYLEQTLSYAQAAYDYLYDARLDAEDLEAIPRYNRNFRAALNNVIFCQTLLLPADQLYDQVFDLVREQEHFSEDPQLWHENRYSDTIGRYYYRLARITGEADYFAKAQNYNQRSIDSKGLSEKSLPQQLHEALAKHASAQ